MPKSISRRFRHQEAVKGSQSEKSQARRVSSTLCVWTVTVIAHSGGFLSYYSFFPELFLNWTVVRCECLKGTVHTVLFSEQCCVNLDVLFLYHLFSCSYRCDEFVVNDTKLGHVQRVREHLQSLEKYVWCLSKCIHSLIINT